MSRIGKKVIPIPPGVTYTVEGNTIKVQGPKGKLDTVLPKGIRFDQQDGNLVAIRENDSQAAVHGLARALVNNAVEGVTKGWTRDLEIVGIGYRAELKGKGTVVFSPSQSFFWSLAVCVMRGGISRSAISAITRIQYP